jgi:hypothetical protein
VLIAAKIERRTLIDARNVYPPSPMNGSGGDNVASNWTLHQNPADVILLESSSSTGT